MENIVTLEEFVEKYIKKYYHFMGLNENVVPEKIYNTVFDKIPKIKNEKILVINSVPFAELLAKESASNRVCCIYFNKDAELESLSNVKYEYVNFGILDGEITQDTQDRLTKIHNDFNDVDKIFNFSLPMIGYRYDHIARFNYVLFKKWFSPGITSWISFDEWDVQEQFSKFIYYGDKKNRHVEVESKEVPSEVTKEKAKIKKTDDTSEAQGKYKIGKTYPIPVEDWNAAGFDGKEDRYYTYIFVRSGGTMGGLSAEDMEREDMSSKGDIEDGILNHYIEPRIYCFTADEVDAVIQPKTALKVGDTDRSVAVRISEWNKRFPGLHHINDWPAVISGCGDGLDGKAFRDYTVHRVLESSRFNKIRLQEKDFGEENLANKRYSHEFFFDTTDKEVEEAIEYIHELVRKSRYDIISKLQEGKKRKSVYIEPLHKKHLKFKARKLQEDTIKNFKDRYKAGDREMLMYAVMRFGKTYTACRCAQELGGKFTVIVSAKADVKGEWLAAMNPYEEFKNYDMYLTSGDGSLYGMLQGIGKSKRGKKKKDVVEETESIKKYDNLDEYLDANPEKHVVLFITLQDLNRYVNGTKSDSGMKYFDCFIKRNVDLLIIDEAHYGPQGKEYGKGIGEGWDIEERDENDEEETFTAEETAKLINSLTMNNTVKLHLSGTPYDLVARGKFKDDSIIAKFGFEDLMKAKQDWLDEHYEDIKEKKITVDKNPYFGIPKMIQFGYKFSDFDLRKVAANGPVNFINLFKVVKNEKGEYKFKYETEILNMLKTIDGSADKRSGVMAILDSPSLKKEKMCKHIVMVLPRRRTCDVMAQLLDDYQDELKNLGEYKVVNIASEKAKLETEDAKEIIRTEAEAGNKTISLTVIQMLTGVSVKEWDTMLYMKDGSGAQSYDQARFRIQTPNIGERELLDVDEIIFKEDGTIDGHASPVKDEKGETESLKIDKKPQTLFVDFAVDRCYKILYDKLHTECIIDGHTDAEKMFDYMEAKMKEYLKYMPILANNVNQLQQVEIENVMIQIFRAFAERNLKGETFDEKLAGMDWKAKLDYDKYDYSFMNNFTDSYKPGTGRTSLSGHMIKGHEVDIENMDPAERALMEELADDEEAFEREREEDGIEIPPEEMESEENENGADDTEYDSDYDAEAEEAEKKELEKKWKDDEINDKCNALMKNIMIYMLCRNDDTTVFKDIHDLVWDSMRKPFNHNVILNIFDPKHANEPNPKRKAYYVQKVRNDINMWHKIILKNNPPLLEQTIAMIVGACLSKKSRHDFNTIRGKINEFGKGAIGKTEFITPDGLSEKMLTFDNVVIFNKESRILDCYGSKTGEILNYIITKKEPNYNIDNYFIICKNGWVAELNKAVMKTLLKKQGRVFGTVGEQEDYLSEHVLVCDPEKEDLQEAITEKWGTKNEESEVKDMPTFDICIGNPPYGTDVKGGSRYLHYMILKSVLDVCTDKLCFIMPSKPITQQLDDKWLNIFKTAVCTNIEIISKKAFPNTKMDKTAIYYCDRKASPDDYDKQLDVDEKIYNAIDEEGHRLYLDGWERYFSNEEHKRLKPAFSFDERTPDKYIAKLKDGVYYLNINTAGVKPGEGEPNWISSVYEKIGIRNAEEEAKVLTPEETRKQVIECPSIKYGESIKNLFINGLVFRYSLWLTQINQSMGSQNFKYIPNIDYTNVDTDEKLLATCGFKSDEIEKIMNYLKGFNFKKNRNDLVRGTEEQELTTSDPEYWRRIYENPKKKTLKKKKAELEDEFEQIKNYGKTEYEDFYDWLAYEKYPQKDYSFLSDDEEGEA